METRSDTLYHRCCRAHSPHIIEVHLFSGCSFHILGASCFAFPFIELRCDLFQVMKTTALHSLSFSPSNLHKMNLPPQFIVSTCHYAYHSEHINIRPPQNVRKQESQMTDTVPGSHTTKAAHCTFSANTQKSTIAVHI